MARQRVQQTGETHSHVAFAFMPNYVIIYCWGCKVLRRMVGLVRYQPVLSGHFTWNQTNCVQAFIQASGEVGVCWVMVQRRGQRLVL